MIPQRVHLIGIAGAGMRALAQHLLESGRSVSGSEKDHSPSADELERAGATVYYGHRPENLANCELVVVSDAIPTGNVEIEAARTRHIGMLRRAECVDTLARGQRSIFVAGSHGKSTTTGMIACVLESAGHDPSFILGGDLRCLGDRRGRAGKSTFVAEACEAFRNLENFNPEIGVITNADDEHVNHYASQAGLDQAFASFANRASIAIVSGDDAGTARFRHTVNHLTTFGLVPECDLYSPAEPHDFIVSVSGRVMGPVALQLPGDHNRRNALAAIAACLAAGLPFDKIASGLSRFSGVARRWHEIGTAVGVKIIDDFAHHPAEIAATLTTARTVSAGGRLVAIVQPLLHSRINRLYTEFVDSLSLADVILLAEVDSNAEAGNSVGSAGIAAGLTEVGRTAHSVDDVEALLELAERECKKGDTVLVMGAKAMEDFAPRLYSRLQESAAGAAADDKHPRRDWLSILRERLGRPKTFVDLFRKNAREQPDTVAIVHAGRAVSYAQLDARSDAVAGGLAARGLVGRVIGVSLPHSADLIVALLGIMKAGATYLPLDIGLPQARAQYILEHADAAAIITQQPSKYSCPMLSVLSLQAEAVPAPRAPSGAQSAYICFTSGSTGFPKGVEIRHAALFELLEDIIPRFGLERGARMALNTSISFDVSLAEICSTLASGATLVNGTTGPMVGDRLAKFIEAQNITHLSITPTVLASVKPNAYPSLRCIVAAGEACPPALVDDWASNRQFFNAYGPTEATIYATAARCWPGHDVTIGSPLKHVTAHVLDESHHAVPAGELGELYLSGPGVAEGYIDQREETDRRFIKTEFGRTYRTGDMVRQTATGDLEFVGRVDDQIKINGNRLELEEIEQTLLRQPGIADAAVAVTSGEQKSLVCFVVLKAGHVLDRSLLTAQLRGWLPESALPKHIDAVASIPMTSSGKKDRQKLLAQIQIRVVDWANEILPPATETESRLAAIWRDVLKLDRELSMLDRFASLGGDSLSGLILINEIEAEYQLTVPPGYFGRITTIPRMAALLEELLWHQGREKTSDFGFRSSRIFHRMRDLCGHWTGERVEPSSLISTLGRSDARYDLFLCCQNENEFVSLARWLPPSFRVHAMRSGHLVIDHGPESIRQLVGNYVDEIETIDPRGVLLFAGVCQGGRIAQAVAENFVAKGRDVPLFVAIEPTRPQPYAGRIALIAGCESTLNPLRPSGPGLSPYDAALTGGYSVDIVESSHGGTCIEPAVQATAKHIEIRTEQALELMRS